MSAIYDANSFTQEQVKMLQEKDQAIEEIQFSLDECTAQLEEVSWGERGGVSNCIVVIGLSVLGLRVTIAMG